MTIDPRRRRMLAGTAAGLAWSLVGARSASAQTSERFDSVIRGGTIVDPALGMQARADLGIRGGRIAAIEPQIEPPSGMRVIDAVGMIVAPGLVDMHAQVYAKRSTARAPMDELAGMSGITAWVSAGDVGIDDIAAFRDYSARHTRCRVYAFVTFDAKAAADTAADDRIARQLAEHRNVILGFMVHVGSADPKDMRVLERAVDVLKRAQMRGRILCHVAEAAGAEQALALLRAGDIVTHPFGARGNAYFDGMQFMPALLAARKRGVIIDAGHGGGSFDPGIARAGLAQGLVPDVISSDMRVGTAPVLAQTSLALAMSAFVEVGLTFEQVLAMTTVNPARIIGREPHLGTLTLGAPADIALLKLRSDAERAGRPRIEPMLTLRSGVVLPK